jgi:hypothetical protein
METTFHIIDPLSWQLVFSNIFFDQGASHSHQPSRMDKLAAVGFRVDEIVSIELVAQGSPQKAKE